MPPFQRRSTGARRIARTTSFGVRAAGATSMPRAAIASAERVIDFAVRGHTPPPDEMRSSR